MKRVFEIGAYVLASAVALGGGFRERDVQVARRLARRTFAFEQRAF